MPASVEYAVYGMSGAVLASKATGNYKNDILAAGLPGLDWTSYDEPFFWHNCGWHPGEANNPNEKACACLLRYGIAGGSGWSPTDAASGFQSNMPHLLERVAWFDTSKIGHYRYAALNIPKSSYAFDYDSAQESAGSVTLYESPVDVAPEHTPHLQVRHGGLEVRGGKLVVR